MFNCAIDMRKRSGFTIFYRGGEVQRSTFLNRGQNDEGQALLSKPSPNLDLRKKLTFELFPMSKIVNLDLFLISRALILSQTVYHTES